MKGATTPCRQCGAAGTTEFCTVCGQPRVAVADNQAAAVGWPTLTGQAFAVLIVSGAIGYFVWEDLAVPTRELTVAVSETLSIDPSDTVVSSCEQGGSLESIRCSARATSLSLIGVLAITAALFLFRVPLMALFRRLISHLPAGIGPAVTSVLAALIFAMTYSNIHPVPELTGGGLIRVEFFPALIGLITLAVTSLGRARASVPRAMFAARDRIPALLRIIIVIAVPILLGRLMLAQLGGLSNMAQEQLVIVTSTLVGALAFIPRMGGEAGS